MIIINKHVYIKKLFESNFFIIFYMHLINSLYMQYCKDVKNSTKDNHNKN